MKRCFFPGWSRGLLDGTTHAFTRLDLVVVLAVLTLLAVVSWPALAHTKPRADLAVCANNLRLVGRAEHTWASDHADLFPWRVPYTLSGTDGGGSQGHPAQNNGWWHYASLSNELVTPGPLVCPSDTSKRPARDFSLSPEGGLLHPSYRDNAVSYFIGLDVYLSPISSPYAVPVNAALGGDRHLRVDALCASCSSGVNCAAAVRGEPDTFTAWTNAVHGPVGNILFVDGRVQLTAASRVAEAIAPRATDNGTMHILPPR